jgi:hypothetical protein
MARYELWLSRDDGTRLALLDTVVGFQYVISLHQVGACAVTLPGSFNKVLLAPDRRIEVWRAPANGELALERVYLIRRIEDRTDEMGVRSFLAVGVDGNDLLRRRHVAYAAGSAEASMTDEADDMCREIVVDNLGSDAAAARQISSSYFTVAAEQSAGVSLSKGFSRRNVLTVLQDIADQAAAAGTPIYWHVADVAPDVWQFQTMTGQPGIDHSYPDGQNPVLLSLEYGNLAEPQLSEDYTGEVTIAYAAGQGEGAARTVVTAEDTTRSGRSLFGRCEGFKDARNEASTAGVTAEANVHLGENAPRRVFAARIVDNVGTRYGLEWRWGDKVTALYAGESFDAIIKTVLVRVDGDGLETIDARLDVNV